jgi:hypothetical protein
VSSGERERERKRERVEGEAGLGRFDRPRGLTGWVKTQLGGLGWANGPKPISKLISKFYVPIQFLSNQIQI